MNDIRSVSGLSRAALAVSVGVAFTLAWLALQWNGGREVSADDTVSVAYQNLLAMDTFRYTRSTERYSCPGESSATEEADLPLHPCVLNQEDATGEVVLPDTWYERTTVSNPSPKEWGGSEPKEMIVTGGTPYLKSGANWVRRSDLRFRYEFASYFMMDSPGFLDDSRLEFSYVDEARVDGDLTKHYRSSSEGWGYATTLEVWVGAEDGVPRKILRRAVALADTPLHPSDVPAELPNGIPIVFMIDMWKSDTIVFYDFNSPILIEPPTKLN